MTTSSGLGPEKPFFVWVVAAFVGGTTEKNSRFVLVSLCHAFSLPCPHIDAANPDGLARAGSP